MNREGIRFEVWGLFVCASVAHCCWGVEWGYAFFDGEVL